MEVVAVSAARWVLGKALGSVADGLLEAWAASAGLGPNIDALKMELLYAQGMLDNAQGREIRSPALKEMLLKLQQLAYGADDVLDELEYFRIQDMLDGTCHAADVHDGGCIQGLTLNARHTARAIARKLKICSGSREGSRGDPDDEHEDDARQGCLSGICSCGRLAISSTTKSPSTQSDRYGGCMSKVASCARRAAHNVGKRLPCSSFPCVHNNAHSDMLDAGSNMPGNEWESFCSACQSKIEEGKHVVQTPKLKFDRVDISKKMKDIVEKLKPVSAKVSTILDMELLGSAILKLELLGSNTTTQKNAMGRPETTPDIIEPKLYGRDNQKRSLIDGITDGQYFANDLVVVPIVGPGGIGKTTFTQHVYDEVKKHFEVSIWICVSLNFNVSRLAQEAVRKIPKVDNEKENSSAQELIEQRLKTKRFLLVLDDMWTCQEDEWKKLKAPFGRGGAKGNVVIVTTRIPEVAEMVKTVYCSVQMDRLGDKDFMHFFEACVFGYQQPWKDCLELRLVGKKIVRNLKGFPLAAKTVGRLLRKQLTLDHWTSVLESKEWELQTNDNDIMPALKLSYDYLPFHLQQCFSYCSLFPEDYEFLNDELIHLWIGLDILHTCGQNKRTEDIARSYLVDLVNHGFLKRNEKDDGTPYYVVHDLLHNLAVKVSSYECISINSSNVRSIEIPISVRHLSIVVDDKDVENRVNFENFKKELRELDKRLNVENLRTLMLFGSHHGSYAKIFGHLFREARALRATYVSGASYNVEDMLHNFSKFVHLRYLRIKSSEYNDNDILCLPAALSRLYHLEVIDLREWRGCFGFTRHMSNLEKLHHFLVPEHKLQLHSDIVEVGKMKLLQELRRFEVGKESKGFDLSELRQLSELGGSLVICSLERIQAMKEADEARLIQVKRLHKLTLEWGADRPEKDIAHEENALEILVPHSNLQHLCIKGHGGIKCPQWLGEKLSVKNLESLHLDGVAWNIFPPIGELWLVNGPHEEISSNVCNKKFQNLRRLELIKLPRLKKWAVDAPCQLFAHLEVLIIKDCSKLTKLSFAHSTCCQQEKEKGDNMNWFPSLRELEIYKCPELSSFPPIPWTSAPCSATGYCWNWYILLTSEFSLYLHEYTIRVAKYEHLRCA
ncbi:putative disease resistance protein RGA3 isoform X2 [Setaria italica]|uniref:putative disease resistance protein RGA3 isoform X2 n=1 Tax=Setaria italica TaxID=4555 RepID=UPI000BE54854|nr:putative disease resistance protein RGA3 isoform X2 [Setaria italica]